MSKFIADKAYRMINENNELVVCCVVTGEHKRGALLTLEEIKSSEKKFEVQIKEHRSQRSLEQNRLLWALLGKMAEAMSGNKRRVSSEECYCIMLEEANVKYDYMLALPEAEEMLRKTFRAIRKLDEREVNGKTLNMYQYFIGSSKFNTKEMTELIETTLDKLAELGIYDSEIELARREYQR
ncbi:MAG: recombination protein NinB [Clostridia bacterium]|nr:recombination protein NinB [Clostridia bacterium]